VEQHGASACLGGRGLLSADVRAAAAGHQYFYMLKPAFGDDLWKNDPYALEIVNSDGNSVIVDRSFAWGPHVGYGMPPWDELVLYEIHAGTFNDDPGGGPGSFDSIIPKLDYLRDAVSVNGIVILPAAEFMGGISLGYNPSHLFAIEREYGGAAGFQRFVRAAHERHIAVGG
jgi:1,4-alpha-glucan branching enzyme